uniref:AAA_13 domain-containing protein n=1 Tax=Strongyloides venezuelensis TaxID=75913 RepID=A0A0K0G661_STRVS
MKTAFYTFIESESPCFFIDEINFSEYFDYLLLKLKDEPLEKRYTEEELSDLTKQIDKIRDLDCNASKSKNYVTLFIKRKTFLDRNSKRPSDDHKKEKRYVTLGCKFLYNNDMAD